MSLDNKLTSLSQSNEKFLNLYFGFIGVSVSVVYAAAMNSLPFFQKKLPNIQPSFTFPIPFHFASFLIILTITQLSNRISYNIRMRICLIALIAITIFLPTSAFVFENTVIGQWIVLILMFLAGIFNNFCFASANGLSSQISGKYTAYFLIGVSIGGLAISNIRFLCDTAFQHLSSDENPTHGILCNVIFFGIAVCFIVIGFIFQIRFARSKLYLQYCEGYQQLSLEDDRSSKESYLIPKQERTFKNSVQVFREIQLFTYLMLIAYVQHHLCYPGLMLKKKIPEDVISPTTKTTSMITIFSIFTIVGKKLGQYRNYYSQQKIIMLILIRCILLLFFVLQAGDNDVPILNTIWFGYLNIIAFAVSQGLVNVAVFILGPETVPQEKKDIAGFVMVFATNVGAIGGDISALILQLFGLK